MMMIVTMIMIMINNSKWRETAEINGKAATIFKLVRFSSFSLYCVSGDKVEVGQQRSSNWRLAMRDILETVIQVRDDLSTLRKLAPDMNESRSEIPTAALVFESSLYLRAQIH